MEKKKLLIFLTIIYIFYEVVSKLFLKWSVDTVFCLALINISKYDLDLEKLVKTMISKSKSCEQCKKNPI